MFCRAGYYPEIIVPVANAITSEAAWLNCPGFLIVIMVISCVSAEYLKV